MNSEEWRKVPGSDVYEVSNLGRIRTVGRYVNTCYGAKRFVKPRVLNLTGGKRVYTRISKKINGTTLVHRLVAMAWIPNPEGHKVINHKNGIRNDNRVENLEWCTQQHNMAHAMEIGLSKPFINKSCEESISAKLTNDKVREIKRKLMMGVKNAEIAREYGVVKGTISEIKRGKTWVEIPWEQQGVAA